MMVATSNTRNAAVISALLTASPVVNAGHVNSGFEEHLQCTLALHSR